MAFIAVVVLLLVDTVTGEMVQFARQAKCSSLHGPFCAALNGQTAPKLLAWTGEVAKRVPAVAANKATGASNALLWKLIQAISKGATIEFAGGEGGAVSISLPLDINDGEDADSDTDLPRTSGDRRAAANSHAVAMMRAIQAAAAAASRSNDAAQAMRPRLGAAPAEEKGATTSTKPSRSSSPRDEERATGGRAHATSSKKTDGKERRQAGEASVPPKAPAISTAGARTADRRAGGSMPASGELQSQRAGGKPAAGGFQTASKPAGGAGAFRTVSEPAAGASTKRSGEGQQSSSSGTQQQRGESGRVEASSSRKPAKRA